MLDLTHRGLAAEGDTAIIGDIFGELPCGDFYGATKITAAQQRNHGTPGIPGARIIDNRLQAVTHFNPVFALVGRHQKEEAAIVLLAPDA